MQMLLHLLPILFVNLLALQLHKASRPWKLQLAGSFFNIAVLTSSKVCEASAENSDKHSKQ